MVKYVSFWIHAENMKSVKKHATLMATNVVCFIVKVYFYNNIWFIGKNSSQFEH